MSKLKQNLLTIVGAIVLFIIFAIPLTKLNTMFFRSGSGGGFGDIGPEAPQWIDAFLYSFPFFLTLLEFFFKKPLLQRRPYLYIIAFFILLSSIDVKFLFTMLIVILIGAIPGSLYHLIKSRAS